MNSFRQELKRLEEADLLRQLAVASGGSPASISIDGRECVNFCSNNYLGLANHPALKEAAALAALKNGVGSGASRLVSGSLDLHRDLEEELAHFKGTEAALLFNSGYQCNTGVLPALAGVGDVILSDAANHASLIDGCRLSKADVFVYRHNDLMDLEALLKERRGGIHGGRAKRVWIVTEALFSMEGDVAPLKEIVGLADRFGASIYIDEAHANGTLGQTGRGLLEQCGLDAGVMTQGERVVLMGTLGKAFGSFGAFIAGSKVLVDYLINCCRTFIYTTSLPPPTVAASLEAVRLVREESWRIPHLRQRVKELTAALEPIAGVPAVPTPIFSLVVGEPKRALDLSGNLADRGYFVQAIRPPTVPKGTSRLRITVSSAHTLEEIRQFARVLAEQKTRYAYAA